MISFCSFRDRRYNRRFATFWWDCVCAPLIFTSRQKKILIKNFMNEVAHTPFDFFLSFYRIMTCVFAVITIRGTSTRWSDWVWTWIWISSKSKTIERNDHSLLPKKSGGWKFSVAFKVWYMPLTAQRLTVRFQAVPRWSVWWSTLKSASEKLEAVAEFAKSLFICVVITQSTANKGIVRCRSVDISNSN